MISFPKKLISDLFIQAISFHKAPYIGMGREGGYIYL